METKLGKRKLIVIISIVSVLVLAAVIAAGIGISKAVSRGRDNERAVFMALSYLRDSNTEMAKNYINKVSDKTNKKIGFAKDSAEVIRQEMIGNKTLSEIDIDVINDTYKLDQTQSAIVTYLSTDAVNGSADGYDSVIDQIVRQMDISDGRKSKYEAQYEMERMLLSGGYLDEERAAECEKLLGKESMIELELGSAISFGNYNRAFNMAVDLAAEDPSDENMILLADVIARAAYSGSYIDSAYLYEAVGKKYDPEAEQRKNANLNKEIEKLEGEVFETEMMLSNTEDDAERAKTNDELNEKREEIKSLEIKRDNPLLYRALNSVETVSGVRGDIVRAKLYYTAGLFEDAEKCMKKAAGSFEKRFCDSSDVVRGLNLLEKIYSGKASSTEKRQASSTVADMLDSVSDNMYMNSGYGYSYSTGLSDAMANELLTDYKYQSSDIYITSIDDSAYPDLTVTVNGREDVISDIVHKRGIVVRDTHYDVKYKAEIDESSMASICFVVDISGSMSGSPIDNAKNALRSFINTLSDNVEVSIVAFDDAYYERTPLTTDPGELLAGVETLYPNGGTNIAEGIRGGIASLKNASGAKNIILMTDGQSGEDYSWQDEAAADGVMIFTVGFGDVNEQYLRQIAELTGGTFTLADSSGDLGSVYSSIGSVIGNRAKITYTVTENVDEAPRYVYIRSDNYDSSQSKEYRGAGSNKPATADTFVILSSLMYTKNDMDYYRNQNQDLTVQLSSSSNSDVESLEIDGKKITPEENSWYVEFKIAPLDVGIYDIKFNFKDGSSLEVDNVIVVYDDSSETTKVYYSDVIKIGSVLLQGGPTVVLDDGTVVMNGIHFYESGGSQYDSTLNAYSNNNVVLKPASVSDNRTQEGYLDWGDTCTFSIDGRVYLSSGDAQNSLGYETIAASGKLTGSIDNEHCTITRSAS